MEAKAASVLLLLIFAGTLLVTPSAEAQLDLTSLVATQFNTGGCCNRCFCTRSIPPQCRCDDSGPTCPNSCTGCACTRSIPPICRCSDVKRSCSAFC